MNAVISVDLGATSGRVVLTRFDGARAELTEVHRFSTAAHSIDSGLRLDVVALFDEIQTGIGLAMAAAHGDVAAVGIDCWAVDYGLLNEEGLLDLPYNYRDERTAEGRAVVEAVIPHRELYSRTGLQDVVFNTINQFGHDLSTGRLERATGFLMLPDLLGFWLTGRAVAERTNASSTALLDPRTGRWDWAVIDRLGLPRRIFPELVEPGTVLGDIITGPAAGIPLVAVGSHDTASAVVGAPLEDDGDVFISSGTWSLVGMELSAPVLTEESRLANFTNEGGVDGTVRYLKNVMGLWVISEAIRHWDSQGHRHSPAALAQAARRVTDAPVFDVNHPSLLPPGNMPARVKALLGGDERLDDPAFFTRSVLESLAAAYADTIAELAHLTGRRPRRVVIVGGGSANTLLNQLTADRTGLPVLAGPVEATAIGNSLIQARAVGLLHGSLSELRKISMMSTDLTSYQPSPERPVGLLREIVTLSNEFGADPAFTRAGGGNSSVKSGGVLWIKPSGVSMATLSTDDLVPLAVDVLNSALASPDPDPALGDPVNHLATLARLDDGPRRPSVEILFHALIDDTFVLHTHPLLINAVTCNADGEELTRRLFGDQVLWVPYVDPGLPLAREIAARRAAYTERTGRPAPTTTFLMNHGLIVSGDDPDQVRSESHRVMRRVQQAVDAATGGLPAVAEAFRTALGVEFTALDSGEVAVGFPSTEAGARFLHEGPLIPDQIVYSGSFPLVLAEGDDAEAAVRRHREQHGVAPVIAVVPGLGVIAVGADQKQAQTALEVYVDALTVGRAATALGRVRALDERERRFIENWEAEAYRKQVATE
ncbi:class II aldolase/adducin family protein [Tessaracoccus sp. MC1865]|uniref:FGGY-family carbohydrate kinase n=1 Tax=Tessaracoccus sp. MC1865 TaxID=2760310 RepID=UPI0016000184|nr:FGGY-family carbohydrate kinase [Tessaracoccus sp. MC1865]MBB1482429.1 class II aldolase/adducin family protein [Tessaracoccus sp. MC1865]QTO38114.1 class II aldolase/adducin family protein [Tessaracoccus sp. MC1865]